MTEQLDMSKPHKGCIDKWRKDWIRPDIRKGLGYMVVGTSVGHPEFVGWIHTSYVVKHVGNEIETRNSRYTLIGEER